MLKKRRQGSEILSSQEVLDLNSNSQEYTDNTVNSIKRATKYKTKIQNFGDERRISSRRKIQTTKNVCYMNDQQQNKSKYNATNMRFSQREEQKLLYQAIKNSMVETKNVNQNLNDIDQMPVFRPTEEEFKDPIEYVEKLNSHYKAWQWGTVKVIPPASFKPQMNFDMQSSKKLPTRYQILQNLSQGVPFNQNTKGHTFQEFKEISKRREKNDNQIDWSDDKQVYDLIENDYWNIVENQVGDELKVEYAADLHAGVYGSGFGIKNQSNLTTQEQKQYLNHPWNFANFQSQKNSLLQFSNIQEMSGINCPWVYVGMKFSTFCWHFEDLMLPSINYSHYGKPKLWYGVPESHREKFDRAVKEKCSLLFKKDPNILLDVITMVSPAYLQSQGVKICKTLQRPGEFIITFPGSYHSGFSTGLNIGEAINFVTGSWFDYGLKCQAIYRASRERIPVFPIEWICIANIRDLENCVLGKNELINIRNSFKVFLTEELKSRKQMENKIRLFYNREGLDGEEKLIDHIEYMQNREEVVEDAFQCRWCTDHCYMSMIQCVEHTHGDSSKDISKEKAILTSKYDKRKAALNAQPDAQQFCLTHQNYCKCPMINYKLIYRYTTQELISYMEKINDAIENYGSGNNIKQGKISAKSDDLKEIQKPLNFSQGTSRQSKQNSMKVTPTKGRNTPKLKQNTVVYSQRAQSIEFIDQKNATVYEIDSDN